MAFKLKTGKTINKVLAGAGIVALGTTILGMVAPGFMGSTAAKVVLPAISYGVGGVEAAAGAIATEVVGQGVTSFSGPTAEGNVQVERL